MRTSFSSINSLIFIKNFKIFQEIIDLIGNEYKIINDFLDIKILYNLKKITYVNVFFESLIYHKNLVKRENIFILKDKKNIKNNKKCIFIIRNIWSKILLNIFKIHLKKNYGNKIYYKKIKEYIYIYYKKIYYIKNFNLMIKKIIYILKGIILLYFNIVIKFFKKKKIKVKKIIYFDKKVFIYFLKKCSCEYKIFNNYFFIRLENNIFYYTKNNSLFEETLFEIYNKITCLNDEIIKKIKIFNININKEKITNNLRKLGYKQYITSSFTNNIKKNSIEIINPIGKKYLRKSLIFGLLKKKRSKSFEIGYVFFKKNGKIIQRKSLCIINQKIEKLIKDIAFILNNFYCYYKNKEIIISYKNKKIGKLKTIHFLNKIYYFLDFNIKKKYINMIKSENNFKNKYEKYIILKKKIYNKFIFLKKFYKDGKNTIFLCKIIFFYKDKKDYKRKLFYIKELLA
ncbi:hypothetical protein ACWNYO_00450 [Candidatus Vidania fulgoroideorum]